MQGKRAIPQRDFVRYRQLRENGMNQSAAARICGFSRSTAVRYDDEHGTVSRRRYKSPEPGTQLRWVLAHTRYAEYDHETSLKALSEAWTIMTESLLKTYRV